MFPFRLTHFRISVKLASPAYIGLEINLLDIMSARLHFPSQNLLPLPISVKKFFDL